MVTSEKLVANKKYGLLIWNQHQKIHRVKKIIFLCTLKSNITKKTLSKGSMFFIVCYTQSYLSFT